MQRQANAEPLRWPCQLSSEVLDLKLGKLLKAEWEMYVQCTQSLQKQLKKTE